MTPPLTAAQRGDLAERILPIAAHLVCLVHGDGGPRDIHQAIARLNPEENAALLVTLAALVDPDDRPADLLHWITWDEHGQPAPPPTSDRRSLRAIDDHTNYPEPPQPTGKRAEAHARAEEVLHFARCGYSVDEIAKRLGGMQLQYVREILSGRGPGWRERTQGAA